MKKVENPFSSDKLYANQLSEIEQFSFSRQVVNVFPDMINRSVPGYQTIVEGIGKIAGKHCAAAPIIYDLGCSLGTVSLSISKNLTTKKPIIHAVDSSQAMIARCEQHINAFNFSQCIQLHFADLNDFELLPCDLVVMNFTLQFISPKQRAAIIQKIYDALKPGGMLILSEKIKHEDNKIDEVLVYLHHQFKKENGYSDLEISQKRSALEDVMILDTPEIHEQRLADSGFASSSIWFQQYNFISLFAVKI